MLEFYLISTAIGFGISITSNKILKRKNLNDGNITKEEKISKTKFMANLILGLIPFINILLSGVVAIMTVNALKNDEAFQKIMRDSTYSPEYVKSSYERTNSSKDSIIDSMRLDGADKIIILRELIKKKEDETFAEKSEKSRFRFLSDSPTFNEKDYNLAKVQINANQSLFEIECDLDLTIDEKKLLLSNLRNIYLNEIKGKYNLNTMVAINKFEKVLSKKIN